MLPNQDLMEVVPENQERLRVLLAAPVPPPCNGGIANWTRIIRGELESREDVSLDFVDTTVRYRKATNLSLPVRLGGGSMQAMRDTCRLNRKLKAERADVFHLCTSGGLAAAKDLLMLRMARSFGVPSVIHYRRGRLPRLAAGRSAEWRLTRRAFAQADAIVTLDERSEACCREAFPDKIVTTLPNMVEIDKVDQVIDQGAGIDGVPDGCARIVYLGQVYAEKGTRELVEACTRLTGHDLVLDVVGPVLPAHQAELGKIADRRGGGRWLRFFGGVEHEKAMSHLAAADLFVLPSYCEGFPNVVLEAMACRKPIVCTPVGAVPEMLAVGRPEQCGVCAEPRDAEALATAIGDLLDDEAGRRELADKARRRVESMYSVPVACGRLMEFWKSVAR